MEGGTDLWGVFVTLAISAIFAWHGVQGLRTGIARIPIQLFFDDGYERGDTMFGLIVSLNFVGFAGALFLSYLIWSGSL